MRSSLLALVVFVSLPIAANAEERHVIGEPKIMRVPNVDELGTICKTPQERVYACTAFTEKFSCSCEPRDGAWRMRVALEVIPLIYFWNPVYLGHEQVHIDDIRSSLTRFVEELESRQYIRYDDCSRGANLELARFRSVLEEMKDDSNAKHHLRYKRKFAKHAARVKPAGE